MPHHRYDRRTENKLVDTIRLLLEVSPEKELSSIAHYALFIRISAIDKVRKKMAMSLRHAYLLLSPLMVLSKFQLPSLQHRAVPGVMVR